MSLSLDDVRRIARLARVAVTEDEAQATQTQLNRILGLIEDMRAIDTTGIEPMAHAQDVHLRLREDVVTVTDRREKFQSVAPEKENGLYLVPKVIE